MMMMSSNSASSARNYSNRSSPFTASQWEELEHQALIFKYMVSGVPIPPDLLYTLKRSLDYSSLSSRLFPLQQPIGWGCGFQMGGFGSRKADPEPGRCRRTDGKKWRCSKEAYPDSKYCERHMHRGRNRSRKPVENQNNTTPTPTKTTTNSSQLSINKTNPIFTSMAFFDPTPQNSKTHHLFLNSGSSSSQPHDHKDYRYVHGMREGLDEQAFFPEASSGTVRSLPSTVSPYRRFAAQSQFQNFSDNNSKQEEEQQHCFVLGTDFKSSAAAIRPIIKLEKLENHENENQKPLHHFFGEWTPNKNTDSWLDLASSNSGSVHDW